MKNTKLVRLATLIFGIISFIGCSNEEIIKNSNNSDILNASIEENSFGDINIECIFDNLNFLNSNETTALAWEEFIYSDLNEFNYLDEFSFGDTKHTIVLYNNVLYQFYNEELASQIPVTIENNNIIIYSPLGEIVFLTIRDDGKLENQAGLYFNTISLESTGMFRSLGKLKKICKSACIDSYS